MNECKLCKHYSKCSKDIYHANIERKYLINCSGRDCWEADDKWEIEDKDIAELFEISTEQAKKEMDDETIQCIGCDISLEEFIKDFEKLGYTHEEAIELAKVATQPCTINPEIVDEFNKIPYTSFWLTSEETKELLK